MNYTLLVWEEVPENHTFYLIPDSVVVTEFRKWLNEAHGHFINSDETNDGMKFLNTALAESDPEKGFETHLGIFRKYKHTSKGPIVNKHITHVYLSGFVM